MLQIGLKFHFSNPRFGDEVAKTGICNKTTSKKSLLVLYS